MSLPLLPLLAAGGGLLLLVSSSKAKPASTPSSSTPTPTPKPGKTALDFQARIADALSRGDAAALMSIADEMQAAGLVAEAQALRASAQGLQALGALGSNAKPPAASPGTPVVAPSPAIPNPPVASPPQPPPASPVNPAPASSLPPITLPPLVIPSPSPLPQGTSITPLEQQKLFVAQNMAMNLRNTSRYQEDQSLVRAFQAQESPAAGAVDGLYGPKTALVLVTYGVVPPRPRYWSSKTMKNDKNNYAQRMLNEAKKDPARAADWTAASKVANDPAK